MFRRHKGVIVSAFALIVVVIIAVYAYKFTSAPDTSPPPPAGSARGSQAESPPAPSTGIAERPARAVVPSTSIRGLTCTARGETRMKRAGRNDTQSIHNEIYIAQDRMRVEDEVNHTIMIYRMDKDLMWMLRENGKIYREINGKKIAWLRKKAAKDIQSAKIDYKEEGAEDAAGYPCVKISASSEGKPVVTAWLAKEVEGSSLELFSKFTQASSHFSPGLTSQVIEHLSSRHGVPVRTVTYMEQPRMKIESTIEIETMEEAELDGSLFEIPEDYRKLTREQSKEG